MSKVSGAKSGFSGFVDDIVVKLENLNERLNRHGLKSLITKNDSDNHRCCLGCLDGTTINRINPIGQTKRPRQVGLDSILPIKVHVRW